MIAKPLSLPHPDRVRSCDDSILGGGVGGGAGWITLQSALQHVINQPIPGPTKAGGGSEVLFLPSQSVQVGESTSQRDEITT